MPITKRAIKKLHHDRVLSRFTAKARENLRNVIKSTKKNPSKKTVSQAFSTLDKSVKSHLIHRNKAARLKSQLSGLLAK